MSSPDYKEMNKDEAINDFVTRISHYQQRYETMDEQLESHYSFIKVFNTGEKILVHKHEGHIQSRIVYYLMNIHITPRTIYLSRVSNFESMYLHFGYFYCLVLFIARRNSLQPARANWWGF